MAVGNHRTALHNSFIFSYNDSYVFAETEHLLFERIEIHPEPYAHLAHITLGRSPKGIPHQKIGLFKVLNTGSDLHTLLHRIANYVTVLLMEIIPKGFFTLI